MRTLLSLLAASSLAATNAQIDINKMIQEKMGQGTQNGQTNGGGMTVEDDNDPFVPNTFIGSFRMETHFYKKEVEEKNSPSNMRYWSDAERTLMTNDAASTKGQEMKMLTDLRGKWSYMLMTDEKGNKTAMKSRKKKFTVKEDPDKAAAEITVTDETKVIDGHTCKKVIVKSTEGTWTGWVAEDIPAPFNDMARHVKGADPEMARRMGEVKGFPLEYEWVDANGKDRMVCYMRDLVVGTVDAAVFSLDGYEVTVMPAFGQ